MEISKGKILFFLVIFILLVMKEIEKQVEDIEAHEVEELILDSHHFGKFTPELKAKIGFLFNF